MQTLELTSFQCEFLAKVIPCEIVNTDCIESLEETLTGLTKEMVLKQWLDRAFEFFIGINSVTLKDRDGHFVSTLDQFLDSPDVELKMKQTDEKLLLKIEIKTDDTYWYELSVEDASSLPA